MNLKTFSVLLAALTLLPMHSLSAGFKATLKSDIEIGNEWIGNIYKDYSALPDRAGLLNINFHSSLNYAPAVFSWWDYQLSMKKYSDYDFFDYNLHTITGKMLKNFGDWGSLEFKILYQSYQQDNYTPYNFNNLYAFPELKYYITDYTILKIGSPVSAVTYPNYILDFNSSGSSLKIIQEFNLFTTLELNALSTVKTYPEWKIFTSTDGILSSNQKSNEIELGLTLAHVMQKGQAGAYYIYNQLESNANFIDFGSDLTTGTGDESLINSYYDNYSQKAGLFFQYELFSKINPVISAFIKETYYDSRLARNSSGNFLQDKRKDTNTSLTASLSFPVARIDTTTLDLKISCTSETNVSNDYFYDYRNDTTALSVYCRF